MKRMVRTVQTKESPLKEILKLFLSETLEQSDLAIKERVGLILNFFIKKKYKRILSIETRSDQFRKVSLVVEKEKDWFYEEDSGSRIFVGKSNLFLN